MKQKMMTAKQFRVRFFTDLLGAAFGIIWFITLFYQYFALRNGTIKVIWEVGNTLKEAIIVMWAGFTAYAPLTCFIPIMLVYCCFENIQNDIRVRKNSIMFKK